MELYKNKYQIEIEHDGETLDCSSQVVFPIKWTELLDEQLDESSLTLLTSEKELFKPLSKVTMRFWNEETPNNIKEIVMLVSSDIAEELPVGSGKYKHELSLIEETKFLEGFICRSQGYVNPLGTIDGDWKESDAPYLFNTGNEDPLLKPQLEYFYKTPVDISQGLPIATPFMLYPTLVNNLQNGVNVSGITYIFSNVNSLTHQVTIKTPYDDLYYTMVTYEYSNGAWSVDGNILPNLPLSLVGAIQINIKTTFYYRSTTASEADVYSILANASFYIEAKNGSFNVWNARTVIERALTICETLRKGDTPRFRLNDAQAVEFEKIPTPEFQFTQSTLREILQGVGKYVHGEPRLKGNVIYYDMYGGDELNEVDVEPYSSLSISQSVEDSATNIDASVDNIINTLDIDGGVIVEPYASGYKTLRTETIYTRVEDSDTSGLIETKYPIYSINKLECGFIYGESAEYFDIDLTPFVYEYNDYSRLTSYGQGYPSKATCLYFRQNEKNIQGLFYKAPHFVSPIFNDYAVVNALKLATHDENISVSKYPRLAFRVTYKPVYSARVQQSKSNITAHDKPRTLAYNQGQNIVESDFFGENLKGVIARMGNAQKIITYTRYGFPTLPKIGTLFDDDYYISSTAIEYNPYTTKVTVGLTKDFNRLSEHVGINSTKRQYEISERQAFDSHITYKDYVVIGDAEIGEGDTLFSAYRIESMLKRNRIERKVSLLIATGETNENNTLNKIALPVQTVPFGNSALFVSKYADNYSAGNQALYQSEGSVSGYFTNGVPYSDYFGNIEYLKLEYYQDGTTPNNEATQQAIGSYLPEVNNALVGDTTRISTGDYPLWIKKGSTEIPTIDYQIDFVSNRNRMVIGSQLAKSLPLIGGCDIDNNGAKLYLLPNRIKKFNSTVDLTNALLVKDYTNSPSVTTSNNKLIFQPLPFTANGQEYNSWVVVNNIENGKGQLLFGQNKTIKESETDILDGLTISCVHKLF